MNTNYLKESALLAAQLWLESTELPADPETVEEMISCYYPGGLHWFIAQHLVPPCES